MWPFITFGLVSMCLCLLIYWSQNCCAYPEGKGWSMCLTYLSVCNPSGYLVPGSGLGFLWFGASHCSGLPNSTCSKWKCLIIIKALEELYSAFIKTRIELIIMSFMCCKYINTLLWDRACFHYSGSCGTQELLPPREVLSAMSPGDYHLPFLHVLVNWAGEKELPLPY